jgi:RimJ/RimL family protein N-acetyltransferase
MLNNHLFLKILRREDITQSYINWLNNYEVVKFTEQKNLKHNRKTILKYFEFISKSKNQFLYGIFVKNNNKHKHIGNIKLGPINYIHRFAEISYFIGELDYWNKGFATSAVSKIIKIAKSNYKLKKLMAGVYSINVRSKKVLKKNNFKLEGEFKSQMIFQKKRYSHLWFGLKL